MIWMVIGLAAILILALFVYLSARSEPKCLIGEPFDWIRRWKLARSDLPDQFKKLVNAFANASLNENEYLDKILCQFKKSSSQLISESSIASLSVQRVFVFDKKTYSVVIGLISDLAPLIKYFKSKTNIFSEKDFAKLREKQEQAEDNGFLTLHVAVKTLHSQKSHQNLPDHTYVGSLIMEPTVDENALKDFVKAKNWRILTVLPKHFIEFLLERASIEGGSVLDWRKIRSWPLARQDQQIAQALVIANADEDGIYRAKKEWGLIN